LSFQYRHTLCFTLVINHPCSKSIRAGAELTPDWHDDQEAADGHEHRLGPDLEAFLNEPQAVDADCAADALDNGELRGHSGAIVDNEILTDAVDQICRRVTVCDEEIANQIQPGLVELFDIAECKPVVLRADGEVRFSLWQRRRARLFQEEPWNSSENPYTGGQTHDNHCRLQVSSVGLVCVQPICSPKGNQKGDGIAGAGAAKCNVTESVALERPFLGVFLFGELASCKSSLRLKRLGSVASELGE
jgi:hypothetical protein